MCFNGSVLLRVLGTPQHQCRRLEISHLVRVMTPDDCEVLCAVKFESCPENRFVVRWFVHWYAREIAWEGDIDIFLRSEHLPLSNEMIS